MLQTKESLLIFNQKAIDLDISKQTKAMVKKHIPGIWPE